MKILKINGAALSSVENLYIVIALARQANAQHKTIIVVSAKQGTTDLLKGAAGLAVLQNELYKEQLHILEREYLQAAKELIPITEQSPVLSRIKKMCNELEDLCEGVFLVSELPAKVKDRIISYGDVISSYVLSAKLQSLAISHQWSDARDLIQSNSSLGIGGLNFSETGNFIRGMVNNSDRQLFILPDMTIAHHKFSSIVSKSFGIEPEEIAVESAEISFQS